LKKNVTKVFRDLKNWEGKVVERKEKNHPVITLVPCDMSTHNTVTEADHMACFRCKEKHLPLLLETSIPGSDWPMAPRCGCILCPLREWARLRRQDCGLILRWQKQLRES